MIVIQNKVVSDDVVEEHFICDLDACKGACCVEGDRGAPLTESEAQRLESIYPLVKPYLTREGREAVATKGFYAEDDEGKFTTLIGEQGPCAYTYFNRIGQAFCGIEKAYREGKIDFLKPISCHLYPIRIYEKNDMEYLNYDRWSVCKSACALGKRKQMPVYRFVKEALIRKYGPEFYDMLDVTAEQLNASTR